MAFFVSQFYKTLATTSISFHEILATLKLVSTFCGEAQKLKFRRFASAESRPLEEGFSTTKGGAQKWSKIMLSSWPTELNNEAAWNK